MKTQQLFKKSNVTTITILLVVIIGFITGCEKENIVDNDNAYSEYLELDIYNKYKMKEKEFEIISQAIQRLEINREEGLYKIKETSAEELNISPKLFNYITAGFDYSNSIISPKSYKKSSKLTVRLKSGNFEDEYDQEIDTYCASYCVSSLSFWVSLKKAKNYQDAEGWSNGVPTEKMDEFVKHFYKDATISSGVNALSNATPGKTIVTFRHLNGSGNGHAAIFHYWSPGSEYVNMRDPQNGNRLMLVHKDDIIKVYKK